MKIFRAIFGIFRKLDRWYWLIRVKSTVASHEGHIYVGGAVRLSPYTHLKGHVNFNGMRIIGRGKCTIGSYFHSGQECMIITGIHNYDHGNAIPYDETEITKDVLIEDFVWLGSRVIILPGVTIGEGAIIQAGAVVTKNIPKYAIAGGSPASVFKYRDIEHFNRLKDEKKFH
jgi:chloramphenicol O-acetyltransferase type B